jgi:SSS family solute:Na+ symporter
MLAGLIIVPVVSAFTKAPDKAALDSCFSCYEETVQVKVSEALGNSEDSVKA